MEPSFRRLCTGLAVLARLLFWLGLLGLGVLAVLLVLGWLPEVWVPGMTEPESDLLLSQRLVLWGLAVVVATPGLIALLTMAGLFRSFAKGEVFTADAATAIRRIGLMLALGAVLKVIVDATRTVVVTITNPPGERMLAISLGSQEMLFVVLAGLLVVIGHAMAEAARMQDEMRTII